MATTAGPTLALLAPLVLRVDKRLEDLLTKGPKVRLVYLLLRVRIQNVVVFFASPSAMVARLLVWLLFAGATGFKVPWFSLAGLPPWLAVVLLLLLLP